MENFLGRQLTATELTEVPSDCEKIAGMTEISKRHIRCNRCGTRHEKSEVQLPIGSFYCPNCIALGRVRSDEFLYHLPQESFPSIDVLNWAGQLTEAQAEISEALKAAVKKKEQVLVHAVTGAGKTEMIYAAIDESLRRGEAVCIASPRIDVCIELHARLSRDFACEIPLLHGEGKPYFRAPLVIATTHQLLRFKEAFDLLIIDEVDAFPFVDNDSLYFAAEKARKKDAALIFLTATSTDKLDQQVAKGQLKKLTLARRFHRQPLPVPQLLWQSHFLKALKKQRLTGFPLLIFAPEISYGTSFAANLQEKLSTEKIAFVASTSENRLETVENFRSGKIQILVSTTILERGVTFPKVDVFVLNAEHQTFSKSALIQIAGRAGRSPERPTGTVFFFHQGRTKAMTAAIADIKKMNQKAGVSQ